MNARAISRRAHDEVVGVPIEDLHKNATVTEQLGEATDTCKSGTLSCISKTVRHSSKRNASHIGQLAGGHRDCSTPCSHG